MGSRIRSIGLIACVLLLAPLPSWAIGSITDGDVTFAYPTSFNSSAGNTVNANFNVETAGDHLYETWWFYRVSGATGESALRAPDLETYSGNYALLEWTDVDGTGRFDATLELAVFDPGTGGQLFQELTVQNVTATPLTLDIFHYADFDAGGTWQNESATLVSAGPDIEMAISDGSTLDQVPWIGYGADAFEVTTWNALLGDLTDGATTNLANGGLPYGPGDFTGAFQWVAEVLAPGETRSFLTQFGTNAPLAPPSIMPTPEAETGLLMFIGLAGLAYQARRARIQRDARR